MESSVKSTEAATERFFRQYYKHCTAPDSDTLFNFLNAAHSLNDKLSKSHNKGFFDIEEFSAIKALRNIFHHDGELISNVRVIPANDLPPISTDLLFLCLVPSKHIEQSIESIAKKYREKEEGIIRSVVHWYGSVTNINPCIYNFAVKVYEMIAREGIKVVGKDFEEIENSYNFEIENGYSHYVTGKITCSVGDTEDVLRVAFAEIT
jgi:hypothetical protein